MKKTKPYKHSLVILLIFNNKKDINWERETETKTETETTRTKKGYLKM